MFYSYFPNVTFPTADEESLKLPLKPTSWSENLSRFIYLGVSVNTGWAAYEKPSEANKSGTWEPWVIFQIA